jgi:signal transduction histidine kinase
MLEGFAYCKIILDDNGRPVDFVYLDVNSQFSRLTGLKDVVGKRVTEVIPGIKEESPELFEIYGRVALTGKPERFEINLESLALSLAISVSSPVRGKFVAVFEDISERKRMEESLRSLHQHSLRLASAKRIDDIVNYTLDTMEFTLGFDCADFNLVEEGLLVTKAVRGEMGSFSVPLGGPGIVAKAALEKKSIRVSDTREELSYLHHKGMNWKGPPTMLSELASPVVMDGRTVAVLNAERGQARAFSEQDQTLLENLAAHVASEMKRLEHQRQLENYSKHLEALVEERTRELRKAERLATVGETAAMVGHDLRNPLQGIAGAAYMLKQESLPAQTRNEMIRLIESNIDYSDNIVRDLLEYSTEIKLTAGQTPLNSIIQRVIQSVKVPERITVRNTSKDHTAIRVDPDKMRRVITNIVKNAIDAMPHGGTLTIGSKRSEDAVEITISDTGVGMPEKITQNLWKPLQTTKAKGLGLGLAISKRIVDAHGGTISAKSKIGEGTTITITLPIESAI